MFAGYLFLRFKNGRAIRQINTSQTLMNLQYNPRCPLIKIFDALHSLTFTGFCFIVCFRFCFVLFLSFHVFRHFRQFSPQGPFAQTFSF